MLILIRIAYDLLVEKSIHCLQYTLAAIRPRQRENIENIKMEILMARKRHLQSNVLVCTLHDRQTSKEINKMAAESKYRIVDCCIHWTMADMNSVSFDEFWAQHWCIDFLFWNLSETLFSSSMPIQGAYKKILSTFSLFSSIEYFEGKSARFSAFYQKKIQQRKHRRVCKVNKRRKKYFKLKSSKNWKRSTNV